MIADLWETFPRALVHHVNGLLDTATPTPHRAFMIYKACQTEGLWEESFEKFSHHLTAYYATPRSYRKKSDFDRHLLRPMSKITSEIMQLNFNSAQLCSKSIQQIASWAHHVIRCGYRTESEVIAIDILDRSLQLMTQPEPGTRLDQVDFEDFCEAWQTVSRRSLGHRCDQELQGILQELREIDRQLKEAELYAKKRSVLPTIYLTQTEIDWILDVKSATLADLEVPKFPLSRGPQKQRLLELERTAMLYRIVQRTALPELLKHRDRIRITLLHQCEGLIRDKAA